MFRTTSLIALAVLALSGTVATSNAALDGPAIASDGKLKMPAEYCEWVYLTSGLDVSYSASASQSDHSMFDNVFVNPWAYRAF
jgi:hypothetical protein